MPTSISTDARPIARPSIFNALNANRLSWVAATLLLFLATATDLHAARDKKKKKKKKEDIAILSGTVMSQAEEILAGVTVGVRLEAADFSAETVTDKKGQFSVEVPTQGEYLLTLAKEGFATFENSVYMALGEEQAIQVKLLDAAAGQRNVAIKAYNAGANAYEARDLAAAKQHFLAAVEADPSLAEPFLVLADIHIVEGDHALAADAAEKFLALKPGDQKGQMLAYEAYQKLGNEAKVEELRTVLAETDAAPQLAIQVYNEGAIADQEGNLERAIAKFSSALGLDPSLSEAHAGLATVYYRVQRFDEALASVEALLAAKPEHAQGHRMRYLIQEGRGDRAGAEAAMTAYIGIDPKGASTLLYKRADLDFRAGEIDLAKAALLKILELDPEMARAHFTLGKIYASSDTGKAKEHLKKFIEMAPDDPEVSTAKEMLTYF